MIGFAAISFAWILEQGEKSAWLNELDVSLEHRGLGVGDLMVERYVHEMKKKACSAIDLEIELDHRWTEQLNPREGSEKLGRSRWVEQLYQAGYER